MTNLANFGSDKALEGGRKHGHFCLQPCKTIFKHVFRPNANFFDPGEVDLKQKVFLLHPNVHLATFSDHGMQSDKVNAMGNSPMGYLRVFD